MSKPKTIEELQTELNDSQESLVKAQELSSKLQSNLDAQTTDLIAAEEKCTEALAALDTAKQENADLNAVNDELSAKIEELTSKQNLPSAAHHIEKSESSTLPEDTFEVDDIEYRFISPVFMFKGERIVAQDVINDEEKLKSLIAAGVGAIQPV